MFRYYNTNNLAFTNLQNGAPYLNIKMTEEDLLMALNSLKPLENLNLYNVIRKNNEYFVYKCKNIRPRSNFDALEITKDEFYGIQDESMINDIKDNLINFYKFSLELQNNNQNKNITLANLEKLGNLQQESYTSFLRDLDLQTLRYGV
jgi:hypothetical protein